MPTREEMITKIYQEIADKTLSEWCLIDYDLKQDWKTYIMKIIDVDMSNPKYVSYKIWLDRYNSRDIQSNIHKFETIWHPVMIWDILYYMDYDIKSWNRDDWQLCKDLVCHYREQRKPIEAQDDDCIKFVFDLLPKN